MERPSPGTDRQRAGFTLVESLIASVVLAVTVVGIAGTLAATYQNARDQSSAAEATQLARQLMEEISARPFEVPPGEPNNATGWSGGNTNRATYDDIQDYHGYTDISTSITTLGGTSQSFGSSGPYTRSVAVTTGTAPAGHAPPPTHFKHVKVTVTRPRAQAIELSKVFTNLNRAN
ncbi:MAG TPA: prepilin-type N-terminal cleavage/methylation domain-containing protein [Tepidisphaeraceae bacterium]|nr:prepilin-type N-terminal cleavage/methylation domain-containing protein [Tepidisphaeraceae bacterium]